MCPIRMHRLILGSIHSDEFYISTAPPCSLLHDLPSLWLMHVGRDAAPVAALNRKENRRQGGAGEGVGLGGGGGGGEGLPRV